VELAKSTVDRDGCDQILRHLSRGMSDDMLARGQDGGFFPADINKVEAASKFEESEKVSNSPPTTFVVAYETTILPAVTGLLQDAAPMDHAIYVSGTAGSRTLEITTKEKLSARVQNMIRELVAEKMPHDIGEPGRLDCHFTVGTIERSMGRGS